MKRKTIYLSIPITGIENSIESREKAALTQANYERQGFIVNNPHVIADELTEILNRIPIEAEKMAADIDYLAIRFNGIVPRVATISKLPTRNCLRIYL